MTSVMSIVVSVVLGILAILAGIIDFCEKMGLPHMFERRRHEKNKELSMQVLKDLGLLDCKQHFMSIVDRKLLKERVIDEPDKRMNELIIKYVEELDRKKKSLVTKTWETGYYISFMDSITNHEDLFDLAQIMVTFITSMLNDNLSTDNPICFNKTASIKMGNPAFAIIVSMFLEKSCLFIEANGIPMNDSIEGKYSNGDIVVLVHDVIYSGNTIIKTIQALQKSGIKINHVFTLIDRTTDKMNFKSYLKQNKIILHSFVTLTEDDLKQHYLLKRKEGYRGVV